MALLAACTSPAERARPVSAPGFPPGAESFATPSDLRSEIDAAEARLAAGDSAAVRERLRTLSAAPSLASEPETLIRLASLLEETGDGRTAEKVLGTLLTAPHLPPASRADVARALGEVELGLGNLSQAAGRIEHAASALQDSPASNDRERYAALHALARLRNFQGRGQEAFEAAEAAVAGRAAQSGLHSRATLQSRAVRAVALLELGRSVEAATELEAVVLLQEHALGALRRDTLASRAALAAALNAAGDPSRALVEFRRIHDDQMAVHGATHPDVFLAAYNVATTAMYLGLLGEATRVLGDAIVGAEAYLGSDHPDVLALHDVQVAALDSTGRLDEALVRAEEVHRASAAKLGANHPDTIRRLFNLAHEYDSLGRSEEALALVAEAARLQAEVTSRDNPQALYYLTEQAVILQDLKRPHESRAILERVLQYQERAHGSQHPDTLETMDALGAALRQSGDAARALALQRRTLDARRVVLGGEHRQTLYTLANLALAQLATGDVAGARMSAQQALAGFDRTAQGNSPHAVTALLALVDTELAARDAKSATASLERLVKTVESLRSSPQLSPENRRALLARAAPGYKRLAWLEAAAGASTQSFATSELGKARTLLDSLTARRADESALLPPQDRADLAELALRAERLVDSIAGSQGASARAELEAERNAALRAWSERRAALLREHPRYAALANVRLATVDEGAAALPRGSVFVSYVVAPERLIAFTITSDATLRVHDLGPANGLEPTIRAWRAASLGGSAVRVWRLPDGSYSEGIVRPPGATPAENASEVARALARRLLGPIPELAAARWIVAPDGPLSFLPFEALPWKRGLVIDTKTVSYTQSLSTFVLVRERERAYATRTDRRMVLAVGAADYARADGRREWAPLPASEAELDAVAAVFDPALSAVLRGREAAEDRLLQLDKDGSLASYRFLLFSTHGRLDPQQPARSAIVLSQFANPAGIDGYVTAAEWPLYNLAADLVFLSACETGVGALVQGEGVSGLPYALYVAGARNAALSLWSVEDRSTAELVAAFFRHVANGHDQAEALALAKRQLRADRRHRDPFFWAPFVLYGS